MKVDGISVEWMSFARRPHARARLFCFPHAGGGAAVYRPWSLAMPEEWDVVALQLPGRGHRLRDPLVTSMPALVDGLLPALRAQLDLPFAFFGHSMGAVLASELARAVEADQTGGPAHLVISGRRPPHVISDDPPLHRLSDEDFIREMNRRYGGIPAELLRDREVLDLLLPGLRADMTALETHRPPVRSPLSCPITVYGGADDPLTPVGHLEAWRTETSGPVRIRRFPGGHFYLNSRLPDLLADLMVALAPVSSKRHAENVPA